MIRFFVFWFFLLFPGDGNVSFEEFVEIVSNIGANETAPTDQDQEEQELRDAFRVRFAFYLFPLFLETIPFHRGIHRRHGKRAVDTIPSKRNTRSFNNRRPIYRFDVCTYIAFSARLI